MMANRIPPIQSMDGVQRFVILTSPRWKPKHAKHLAYEKAPN